MNDNTIKKTPAWFWAVSGIALIWNLMGLMGVFADLPIALEDRPENLRPLYEARPSWVTIASLAAVIFGTLGCIGLLIRKKWALPLFVLSLIGVLGQNAHMFFLSDTFQVMGNATMALPIIVLVVAIWLILLAAYCHKKGILS